MNKAGLCMKDIFKNIIIREAKRVRHEVGRILSENYHDTYANILDVRGGLSSREPRVQRKQNGRAASHREMKMPLLSYY